MNDDPEAPAALALDEVDARRYANLRARAAVAGHTLTRTSAGGFVAARWTYSRHFADLDAVEDWLDRIDGKVC